MSRLLALTVALLLVGCTHAGQKKVANSGDSDSSSESASTESDKDSDKDSDKNSDKDSDSESKSPKSKSSGGDESDVGYAKGKKLPPGPACLDQQGNVQECTSDGDCCKNFYCGIDPDGSARQKVCLYGG